MQRVRLAGRGIISCYGEGLAPLVDAIKLGHSSPKPLSRFSLPSNESVFVNEINRDQYAPGRAGEIEIIRLVIRQAIEQAGLAAPLPRTALITGSSGFLFVSEAEYRFQHSRDPQSARAAMGNSSQVTQPLIEEFGIDGPCFNVHTACSSSANALLLAQEMIGRGEIDRAIVLGIEGLSAIALAGFQSLMLLDAEGCRPFDRERDGLQIGEAYGAIVLESAGDSNSNSAGHYLLGGSNLCDTHHVTSASPDGSQMLRVMQQALRASDITHGNLKGIKAHGTGSIDNDAAEAVALTTLFGTRLPPITAIKRYIGHTLGACAVSELIALSACVENNIFPATAGFNEVDDELGIAPVRMHQKAEPGLYLSNYFGFGGNYAALVTEYVG